MGPAVVGLEQSGFDVLFQETFAGEILEGVGHCCDCFRDIDAGGKCCSVVIPLEELRIEYEHGGVVKNGQCPSHSGRYL